MRYLRKWQLALVCLLALGLLPFAPAPRGTAQAPGYTVTDLGTLGGNGSRAFGLDECGVVVGDAQAAAGDSAPFRPFRWSSGTMTDLGTLGGPAGRAYAINQTGRITGSAVDSSGTLRAFIKGPDEVPVELGTLGGPTVEAYDINASVKIVGVSEAAGSGGGLQERAFLWQPVVGIQELTAPWGTPTRALGINDAGQIAGAANHNVSGTHAFVTIGGVAVDLGTLCVPAGCGNVSFATEVNDAGEVAGYSRIFSETITQPFHAFYWKDLNGNGQSDSGEMLDLGTLGTGQHSHAYDINNSGLIVGRSEITAGEEATHAFIWSSTGGLQDLNSIVTGTGWTFQEARAINDRGQIVGFGLNPDGKLHAFLLTPTNVGPSPCDGTPTPTPTPAPGTLQFTAATYTAGENAGAVLIPVSRTGGSDGTVTVNYATSNGTATAGSDYTATSGTLTFNPGVLTQNISVTINNDALDEADETVNLALSSPTGGATLGSQTTATLTITDDDGTPSLNINDVTVTEGNAGQTAATFTVTLLPASGQTVTVNYATANGTATTANNDYAAASATLTFDPGQTSKTITVNVTGDTTFETDETFFVNLSGATNATIADGQGQGTITNDEAPSTFQFSGANFFVNEGAGTATITVTRLGSTAGGASVDYATSTGGTATAGSDYTATSGTLTFADNETSKTFSVTIANDTLDEPDETVNLTLTPGFGGSPGGSLSVLNINDDDAAPTVSIEDTSVTEGNTGTTNATFNVTLSAASGKTVTVSYATTDGTATQPGDYTSASGTVTFNPGQTSQTVTVQVSGDTLDEPNETFNVNLSSPSNATINDGTGVGTITDDDGAPSLSINDVTVTEGNSGDTPATFTVTLSPASGQTVSVNYLSADGTANAGPDYGATAGTLTFFPGETTKTITVNAFGDTANEPNETFFINLSGATNATVEDAQGQGTINNDDAPTLRFSQATYPVGESAHFVTVTVQRTGDTAPAVGVSFATSDGTASQLRDYTAVSGRLQFAAGETSKTFDVLLTEDAYTEPEETINLTLSNPTGGATLGTQPTATVNLAADDNPPPAFNPIDLSSDFVRQHYHDFLNREPDASGLAFWTGDIEQCGADAGCREVKRINVSAAFFLSIEFQQTGYLVYRTYKAAYGDTTSPNVPGTVPVVRLGEFLPDTRQIGLGVQVGIGNWEQQLEANKQTYMAEFVQRQRFLDAYPLSLTAAQFVDKLNQNAGGVLTQSERDGLVNDLATNARTRAQVLRAVSENSALQQNEFRRAFVLMQYYGYLRRDPDTGPNSDFTGWKFWLDKLNQFNGDFIQAEMVKAFLDSIEYRTRFAP